MISSSDNLQSKNDICKFLLGKNSLVKKRKRFLKTGTNTFKTSAVVFPLLFFILHTNTGAADSDKSIGKTNTLFLRLALEGRGFIDPSEVNFFCDSSMVHSSV